MNPTPLEPSQKRLNSAAAENNDPRMRRLGRMIVRRRRMLLIACVIFMVLFGAVGAGTLGALSLSRFDVPGSESDKASQLLHEQFNTGNPNLLLLVTAKNGDVDSAEAAQAGQAIARELAAQPGVNEVTSYWSHRESKVLRSNDGRKAVVLAWMEGNATEVRSKLTELTPRFFRENDTIKVEVGGSDEVFRQVGDQSRKDFVRAELVILPSVLLLLILVYRRLSPALLTIGIGLFSVLGTLAALRGITPFVMVSTFAANLTLVMGLALGIDYSLFVITRFREELAKGKTVPDAVVKTVETAGRTVLFSGLTVAVSLSVLMIFPFPFLRSFAYAGFLVVLTAAIGAVLILPAALAVLGHRVVRGGKMQSQADHLSGQKGFWYRTTMQVMKRPAISAATALVILLVIGSPFLDVRFGLPDERVLPETASSRIVQQQIRDGFVAEEDDAVRIVAPSIGSAASRMQQIEKYSAELSKVEGVHQVDSLAGSFAGGRKILEPSDYSRRFASGTATWIAVIPSETALRADMTQLVREIRSQQAPFEVLVGGYPAELTDFRDLLLDNLPVAGALIVAVTFVILFLMSGSLLIPLKATVLNLLSLSVMFGSLVWIFQNGNLSDVLGFTPLGRLEPSIPILMFCIAYGLSMDYEVFILSRIKEEYDRTGDNTEAVAVGIQRSAPLVSAAAGIMALSFAAYAAGEIVFLQMLGVGMALAVVVDATLIRAVLAPAFMKLAGKANWWAPAALKPFYRRFNLSEAE
ncbi:MMPL family transporter [Paenibacillus hamazuiensis]|uniref:MMPL family transporter n=1 Tax=Paenibacillus hamazuiensis TaxID=2936508 RepID=UPI00200FBBBE|nr:MMPL family transporter [Paenibacillus hamazuiensis]